MEGFDDLIFLCTPVLMIKDVLLTNTASWDRNNAQGLLRFCLHQPQRDLNMLELNSLVHPAGLAGLLGPFPSSWKGNSFGYRARKSQTLPSALRRAPGGIWDQSPRAVQCCFPSSQWGGWYPFPNRLMLNWKALPEGIERSKGDFTAPFCSAQRLQIFRCAHSLS